MDVGSSQGACEMHSQAVHRKSIVGNWLWSVYRGGSGYLTAAD